MKDDIDILMNYETKLDQSFPTNQFMINGFSPSFRLERNDKSVVLFYILVKLKVFS